MTSGSALTQPIPAVRGQIQRTYNDIQILAGFADPSHLRQIVSDYLVTLPASQHQEFLKAADDARRFVQTLNPLTPNDFQVEIRPIGDAYVQSIVDDPVFQTYLGRNAYRFVYVNPHNIIALQPWIEPRRDQVPTTESELLRFALPSAWDVPVEVSWIPDGPIQILSSNPSLEGLSVDLDHQSGKVLIGASKHLNLVQLRKFQDKYYLINGYHRMVDAIEQGVREVPAVVVEAFSEAEISQQIANRLNWFRIDYVSQLPRPPLISDFPTEASVSSKARDRRYGFIVTLDAKRISIGV